MKCQSYICPKCGTKQLKHPTYSLIIRLKCFQCGHTELLTNILGSK